MNAADIVRHRKIKEVLHFTTNFGLTGVLATKALKCKDQLKEDEYLAHILKINTQKEFDPEWNGHVHLSISRINSWLFKFSSKAWHPELRWRILSFDSAILTHPGVHYVTTNNAYWMHLKRGDTPAHFEALFADQVVGRLGHKYKRTKHTPSEHTTCEQAELLYPGAVSIDFLRRIYVQTPEDETEVYGQLYAMGFKKIEVVVQPDKFVGVTYE